MSGVALPEEMTGARPPKEPAERAEAVKGEVVVYEAPAPATLFRTDEPELIIARASATADALMRAVRAHDAKQTTPAKKLISVIQGRDYPKVECWTLLGTLVGVFPVCTWSRPVVSRDGQGNEHHGWEARVEAHTRDGSVVGAAEAQCTRAENTWRGRDDYALRSMAQTRATSKALRLPLGFVMTLAGLEATPAEEMPAEAAQEPAGAPRTRTQPQNDPAPVLASPEQVAAYRAEVEAAGSEWAPVLEKLMEVVPVTAERLAAHRAALQTHLAKVAAAGAA